MMEWFVAYANWVGNAGVLCFLIAYFLLQKQRISFDSLTYLGLNLVGALLLMSSLLVNWNAPAFILEAFWAMISIYGICRTLRRAR
ncbi:MAG: hypothetical protein EBR02_06790 [Alphaproteobacteria bacterium]|nr:hypothetical protein [Alphaproteobacteria bacterium]